MKPPYTTFLGGDGGTEGQRVKLQLLVGLIFNNSACVGGGGDRSWGFIKNRTKKEKKENVTLASIHLSLAARSAGSPS